MKQHYTRNLRKQLEVRELRVRKVAQSHASKLRKRLEEIERAFDLRRK